MRTIREALNPGASIAVMLLRRSTPHQEKSIPEQRAEIQKWANAHGYKVLAEYVDDAISGDDSAARSEFQRLLADLEKPGRLWNVILCYDRARFTRADIFEAGTFADRILKAGADVVFCAEGKRLSTEHQVVWAVETFQKNEVLKQTSRDVLRGMLPMAKQGLWCGGPPPYGYDAIIIDKLTQQPVRRIRLIRRAKTNSDGTKVPAIHHILDLKGRLQREVVSSTESSLSLKSDAENTKLILGEPRRIEAVKFIFDAFANQDLGYKKIAMNLNKRSIPSPGGVGPWRMTAIRGILLNPIYHGVFEWNSRTEAKYNFIQDGETIEKPRHAKGHVFVHEERDRIRVDLPDLRIVPKELWHRAHKVRALRADVRSGEHNRLIARTLLGGKIICAQCGAKMYGSYSRRRKTIAGVMKEFMSHLYVCSTYLTSGKASCEFNWINRPGLEHFVIQTIKTSLLTLAKTPMLRRKMRAAVEEKLRESEIGYSLPDLQRRKDELKKKIRVWERMDPDDREVLKQDTEFHQSREEYSRILKQLKKAEKQEPQPNLGIAWEEVGTHLERLEKWDTLPIELKRSFIDYFVDRIKLEFRDQTENGRKRRTIALKVGHLIFRPVVSGLMEIAGQNKTGVSNEGNPGKVGSGGGI